VDLPIRELVQNLLVSTSVPQAYGTDGLYYSPRQQGSGVGDILRAISTAAYLTVEGMDTPKAELGHDPKKTGAYEFTFEVNNFGKETLYYRLSTLVQTEDYTTSEDHEGLYFMAGTPKALGATASYQSDRLYLTHDINDSGAIDTHDAYLLSQRVSNDTLTEENGEFFRHDVNKDQALNLDDVQAYLDALVGLESEIDMEDEVLQVEAEQTSSVTVSQCDCHGFLGIVLSDDIFIQLCHDFLRCHAV
jgi:hypothetical protein